MRNYSPRARSDDYRSPELLIAATSRLEVFVEE